MSEEKKQIVPAWQKWENKKIYDVQFEGEDFKAIRFADSIYLGGDGMKVAKDSWMGERVYGERFQYRTNLIGDQSCAYHRLFPRATDKHLSHFKWYVQNVPIKRGTTCYLTSHDGPLKKMLAILQDRGFRLVAKNMSIHGSYNVYLLVHPGDNSKLNKDGDGEDATG